MLQVISDDHLALAEDLVALGVGRRAALEVQLPLQLLVAIEILQRLGRADFERDERIAVAGLAELAEADAVRVGRGELHVVDDLVPADQLVVGADLEAEKLLRRLQRAGRGRGKRRGRDREGKRNRRRQAIAHDQDLVCEAFNILQRCGMTTSYNPACIPRDKYKYVPHREGTEITNIGVSRAFRALRVIRDFARSVQK